MLPLYPAFRFSDADGVFFVTGVLYALITHSEVSTLLLFYLYVRGARFFHEFHSVEIEETKDSSTELGNTYAKERKGKC